MKKRKYTHIKELESILLQMREDGTSRREIAGELGLSLKQGLYVNSWGRAKEDLKNRSERSTAHSCLLGERGAMKDPVSEVIEVANAK